jgi:CubicO group peptidase (beta-lactamase class C family)
MDAKAQRAHLPWLLAVAFVAMGCQAPLGQRQPLRGATPLRFQTRTKGSTPPLRMRWLSRMDLVQRLVHERMTQLGLPSLAAAVVASGETLWWDARGRLDLQGRESVTPHTVYRIGSLTKPLTAMAVLHLRDRGLLNLDAPIQAWMPAFKTVVYPDAQSALITPRHLLTHTSGLPRLGGLDYASRAQPVTAAELFALLDGLQLESEPGTRSNYSNLGYALLGQLVARVSGVDFTTYMDRNVLVPMGLSDFAWNAANCQDRLATGYVSSGPRARSAKHWRMGAAAGLGGLYASLDDMIRLLAYQQSAWPAGARAPLPPLATATLRESHMLGGYQLPTGSGTGAGWGVGVLPRLGHVVYHTGATHQYVATMIFVPRLALGFVALTNVGTPEVTRSMDALGGQVLQLLFDDKPAVDGTRRAL